MIIKENIISKAFIALGFVFLLGSCSDNDKVKDMPNAGIITSVATDAIQALGINENLAEQANLYYTYFYTYYYNHTPPAIPESLVQNGTWPVIVIDKPDTITFPKTITVDFGTGYRVSNTILASGRLQLYISKPLHLPNAYCMLSSNNLVVNGIKLLCVDTLTFNGLNSGMQPYWSLSMYNTLTNPSRTKITIDAGLTRERIHDNGTPLDFTDDKFAIKGAADGLSSKNIAYHLTIGSANPLIMDGGWPFFTKGKVTVACQDTEALIDFGNGAKDNLATMTVNGVTKNITLSY